MPKSHHTDVTNILVNLGLSPNEAVIYLSVLRQGQIGAGKIIEDVRMHREQVYRALKHLVDAELLTTFERKKRSYYSAVDPKVIVQQAKAKVSQAQSVLQYLEELRKHQAQVIKVNEGLDAMTSHLDDILNTLPQGGEYLVISESGDPFYDITADYLDVYHKKFAKQGLTGRKLFFDIPESAGSASPIIQTLSPYSAVAIYGDKIAMELLDPDNPAVVTVQNKKIAESYRKSFEALWVKQKDPKTKVRVNGIKRS